MIRLKRLPLELKTGVLITEETKGGRRPSRSEGDSSNTRSTIVFPSSWETQACQTWLAQSGKERLGTPPPRPSYNHITSCTQLAAPIAWRRLALPPSRRSPLRQGTGIASSSGSVILNHRDRTWFKAQHINAGDCLYDMIFWKSWITSLTFLFPASWLCQTFP